MSKDQINVSTPAGLTIYENTVVGPVNQIKSSPIKLYWASADNTQNSAPGYVLIYGITAFGSITQGFTPADIVLYVPPLSVLYLNFLLDGATPGTTFNQASVACVSSSALSATAPPLNPVTFTLAYV